MSKVNKLLDAIVNEDGENLSLGSHRTIKMIRDELRELEAAALLRQQGWISVEERPLVIQTSLGWEATEEGNGEFLAAVPYHNQKDGKDHWWIRHCVLEDEIGLCVVGDMDNEPAGWQTTDVTHYWPLPLPPTSK
jgi:hypothetical protein